MISAMFNALAVNLWLSQLNINYFDTAADVVQVARFFIGDMLGTAIIFIILALTFRPLLRHRESN
jgi:hypothetical protein